ncbi:hypothetical protein J6Z48_02630 [bacterium]|nr:hypothetical protein [bacterium]
MTLTEAAFWTKRFGVIAVFLMTAFVVAILISLNNNKGEEDLAKYLVSDYACTQTSQEFVRDKLKLTSAVELGEGSEWSFNVQTPKGIIETLGLEVAYVYRYIDVTQSIQSLAHARTIAKNLGFDESKVVQSKNKTEYGAMDKDHTLVILAKTENFSYTTELQYIADTCKKGSVPDYSTAVGAARSALSGSALNLDLDEWITDEEPTYISIEKNGSGYYYTKTNARANANLIKIDFSRKRSLISFEKDVSAAESWKDILSTKTGLNYSETSKIVGDTRIDYYTYDADIGVTRLQNSNISVYVGCEDKEKRNDSNRVQSVYQINYAYWPVETEPCGTYPLISANMAVQALQNGNIKNMGGASLAYLNRKNDSDITDNNGKTTKPLVVNQFRIQAVNFAYYELESDVDHLTYLEPIYVISGEADLKDGTVATFHFYYPAIDYANIKDSTVTSTEALPE